MKKILFATICSLCFLFSFGNIVKIVPSIEKVNLNKYYFVERYYCIDSMPYLLDKGDTLYEAGVENTIYKKVVDSITVSQEAVPFFDTFLLKKLYANPGVKMKVNEKDTLFFSNFFLSWNRKHTYSELVFDKKTKQVSIDFCNSSTDDYSFFICIAYLFGIFGSAIFLVKRKNVIDYHELDKMGWFWEFMALGFLANMILFFIPILVARYFVPKELSTVVVNNGLGFFVLIFTGLGIFLAFYIKYCALEKVGKLDKNPEESVKEKNYGSGAAW
ncbi:MAG: hypothetical protein WCQ32_01990 [bacterium]